jgi:hypothetical protein
MEISHQKLRIFWLPNRIICLILDTNLTPSLTSEHLLIGEKMVFVIGNSGYSAENKFFYEL